MQAEPDKIDMIMAIAADRGCWDAGDEYFDRPALRRRRNKARKTAEAIRAALKAAGYAIQLDEAQLLEKGEKLFKPVPTLANDIFESIAQIRRDIDEITGIKDLPPA